MDWLAMHRRQLARLRGLGVRMTTLNPKLAQRRFLQLLETFVVGELRAELSQSPLGVHATFERALLPELSVVPAPKDVVSWLCANEPSAWIARFDPRQAPALELFASSVQNEWLSSWPGLYLSNDGKRLLCVSVDYERSLSDATPRATPYR
jgi:hypothetical protein